MLSPFNWFRKPKIKVELDARVLHRKDVCNFEIVVIRDTSITCKCVNLFFDNSYFRSGDSYKICVKINDTDYIVEPNLASVNFSFDDDRFVLDFTTNSEIYELLS